MEKGRAPEGAQPFQGKPKTSSVRAIARMGDRDTDVHLAEILVGAVIRADAAVGFIIAATGATGKPTFGVGVNRRGHIAFFDGTTESDALAVK